MLRLEAGFSNAGGEVIPTAILLGLAAGVLTRYRAWSIPVIGLIWSLMLVVDGDPTMSASDIWIAGFVLGAANGAVGVVVGWSLRKLTGDAVREHTDRATHH